MKFIFGFLLGVLLCNALGCSKLSANTKIGLCDIPPYQHEDYTLVSCSAEPNDFGNVMCFYASQRPYGLEIRAVRTQGCNGWEFFSQGVMVQ